jgi:hypothetical protein
MSAKRKYITGRTAGASGKRVPSDKAIKATQRRKAAEDQVIREGTPTDVATRLGDKERSGSIQQEPDLTQLLPEDCIPEEHMDSEVPTCDDDDPVNPDLDEFLMPQNGVISRHPGGSMLEEVFDLTPSTSNVIHINSDGSCEFLRPSWIVGQAMKEDGENDYSGLDRRIRMLDDIAMWLTANRQDFLRSADPIDLGIHAFEEMKEGHASVTPSGFLYYSGIRQWMVSTMNIKEKSVGPFFSRYTTECSLVWEDGSRLPLDFLFETDARNAWVACAVRQFFEKIGKPLHPTKSAEHLQGITIPRNPAKKNSLAGKSLSSLTQFEFIAWANMLAGTKWQNVMETYFNTHGS